MRLGARDTVAASVVDVRRDVLSADSAGRLGPAGDGAVTVAAGDVALGVDG